MKSSRKTFMILAITAVTILMVPNKTFAGNPLKKLGRGIANCAFGPFELPMKIYDISHEEGGVAAITYGTFLGITYVLAREGVGLLEILSFPVPLPDCPDDEREVGWGYGPIMKPEWVVDEQHNMYNIFYNDAPASMR